MQGSLYAEAPVFGRLPGIKEMKIEAVTVGKHHNMCCAPYMWHHSVIVFHDIHLSNNCLKVWCIISLSEDKSVM